MSIETLFLFFYTNKLCHFQLVTLIQQVNGLSKNPDKAPAVFKRVVHVNRGNSNNVRVSLVDGTSLFYQLPEGNSFGL